MQDTDGRKQTALHHAAAVDQPSIISVLIENGILVDAVDDNHNNGEFLPEPTSVWTVKGVTLFQLKR